MLFAALVTIVIAWIGRCNGLYKRWLPNTNFENPHNWNVGRVPCGNDIVIIPDESPVIYVQINTTLKELTLPTNGELIFGNDIEIVFTDVADDLQSCPDARGDVEFSAVHAASLVDPDNWCSSTTELGECSNDTLIETERVPCITDDVVFLRQRSFYVDLSHDLQLSFKSLKVWEKSFVTATFVEFINSTEGRQLFVRSSSGTPTSVTITRLGCDDPAGCPCKNDEGTIQEQICAVYSKRCKRASCQTPVKPVGACCLMCGAILSATRGQGFNFLAFKNLLQSAFFSNETGIRKAISVTGAGILQIVLQDDNGEASKKLATQIKADIDADLVNGGHKYALDTIIMTSSGLSTGTSFMPVLEVGSIVGIVVGIILLITVVLLVVLICRQGGHRLPTLPRLPNLPLPDFFNVHRWIVSHRRGTHKTSRTQGGDTSQPHTVGSVDPGFANPLYDTAPFDDGIESREMELHVTSEEEQPTFEIHDSGFNNPLYGTSASGFISDATKVPKTTVEVEEITSARM